MTQEEYLLKWSNHHTFFFTIIEDLCRTEQLCDVSLVCEKQVFETHKLILSVCSTYFRTLLNSRPDKHTTVYLQDVNPKQLGQLLLYMYRGEISVFQEDLRPLLEVARHLQIKGLMDVGNSDNLNTNETTHNEFPDCQLPRINLPKRSRITTSVPKMDRLEDPHLPQVHSSLTPPSGHNQLEDDDSSRVNNDSTEDSDDISLPDKAMKQEMWMTRDSAGGTEYETVPSEQDKQNAPAKNEQYIQAGNGGLIGQHFLQGPEHINETVISR